MSAVCRHLKKASLLELIVPTAQRLSADSSEFVRSAFATQVGMLAPLLGREDSVTHLLPLLLSLLKDSNSEVLYCSAGLCYAPLDIIFSNKHCNTFILWTR